MIRFASLQKDYDFYVSVDPAFKQRPADEAAQAQYDADLAAARKTGDYRALLLEGQTPTKFVLGQVDRNTWRALVDRVQLPPTVPRKVGEGTFQALVFRLAIRDIPALDEKVERKADPKWDGWVLAQESLVETMDATWPTIISEIATHVLERLHDIDPLS